MDLIKKYEDFEKDNFKVMSYEEFKNIHKKQRNSDCKCIVFDCDNPGEYNADGFPMCEEHIEIKDSYDKYVKAQMQVKKNRELWSKEN